MCANTSWSRYAREELGAEIRLARAPDAFSDTSTNPAHHPQGLRASFALFAGHATRNSRLLLGGPDGTRILAYTPASG
jgi:hypothetical protein